MVRVPKQREGYKNQKQNENRRKKEEREKHAESANRIEMAGMKEKWKSESIRRTQICRDTRFCTADLHSDSQTMKFSWNCRIITKKLSKSQGKSLSLIHSLEFLQLLRSMILFDFFLLIIFTFVFLLILYFAAVSARRSKGKRPRLDSGILGTFHDSQISRSLLPSFLSLCSIFLFLFSLVLSIDKESEEIPPLNKHSPKVYHALNRVSEFVVRDFIIYWFQRVSDKNDFPNEVRKSFDHVFSLLAHRASSVDWPMFVSQHIVTTVKDMLRIFRFAELELENRVPCERFVFFSCCEALWHSSLVRAQLIINSLSKSVKLSWWMKLLQIIAFTLLPSAVRKSIFALSHVRLLRAWWSRQTRNVQHCELYSQRYSLIMYGLVVGSFSLCLCAGAAI